MRVEAFDVRYSYGPNLPDTLKGISLDVPEGSLYGIIGPNGSGKSTLLRVIGGIARPSSGMVLYDGRSISEFSPRQAARTVAAVASGEPVIFPFTVEEIVMMGRSPYLRPLQSESLGRHRPCRPGYGEDGRRAPCLEADNGAFHRGEAARADSPGTGATAEGIAS